VFVGLHEFHFIDRNCAIIRKLFMGEESLSQIKREKSGKRAGESGRPGFFAHLFPHLPSRSVQYKRSLGASSLLPLTATHKQPRQQEFSFIRGSRTLYEEEKPGLRTTAQTSVVVLLVLRAPLGVSQARVSPNIK